MSRRQIFIGNVAVGGDAAVSIQSMCNTPTIDTVATLQQINQLADAGCQIIRLAVPDMAAAEAFKVITASSPIPVIADIHFDYRLAVRAIENGAAAVRVNPGNLGGEEAVKAVAETLLKYHVPVRVGANSGSLPAGFNDHLTAEDQSEHDELLSDALVQSVLAQTAAFERYGVKDIKVSLKASGVSATVKAYRKFAACSDYPLHVGVTEAGTPAKGIVKSSIGIGSLLLDGIGDTIRVSLTAEPLQEVIGAIRILESLNLRDAAPDLVACPTCGRTRIDLVSLAEKVENLINSIKAARGVIQLKKIAVMGCVVNGPGEAKDADLGIAGGDGKVVLFRKGVIECTLPENEGFAALEKIIRENTIWK
ncbi:MAG: flavodoxin-dependent (E)-4-hydroxy-3-methylbut-2-enyl-diphosphate synthase [Lentisphaeria bacterium]|nr:flavodoxin-dependent (E)-4-hydroxy-3-methylbut-2-enyl-diphosphate synthase [Lentisphaeria bacterium]